MPKSPLFWILLVCAFVLGGLVTAAVIILPRTLHLPLFKPANDTGPRIRVVLRARERAEFNYTLARKARAISATGADRMQRRLTDRLRDRLGRDADVDALISGDDVSITTRAESPGVAEEQFSAVEAAMNAMFGAKDIAVRPPNAAACYRPADPTTMELARDVLDTRLREMGMRKATITISGRQITVDTHTGKDPKTTRELLTRCGELRFMLLDSTIEPGGEGAGSITLSRGGVQISGDEALSTAQVVVRGRDIDPGGVGTSLDSAGNPCIGFALKREAARQFETVTGANVRRHLAIVYDGEVLSAPVIAGAIGARGQISGSFTQEQAQSMAAVLKSGALPVPLELVEPGETR